MIPRVIYDTENIIEVSPTCKKRNCDNVANALAADVCLICQDDIKNEYVAVCHHKFCKECTNEWFKISRLCPYCRKPNIWPMMNLETFIELERYMGYN
jgi:hypothetical protein